MARGSVVWRCWKCRLNTTKGRCDCPGGQYYVVYYLGEKQTWKPVSQNKHEAEKVLHKIQYQVDAGLYREPEPIEFGEFVDARWLPYIEGRVKHRVYRRYKEVVYQYLKPAFGSYLLRKITTEMVRQFVESIKDKRLTKGTIQQQIAPRTVNQVLRLLKQILADAERWECINRNPALPIAPLKVEEQEKKPLEPDEIRRFLQYAEGVWKTLFQTLIFTGLRIGEVLALQKDDIDLDGNMIHVNREIFWLKKKELQGAEGQPLWRFSTPKTKKSKRAVVIRSRTLKEALVQHLLTSPENPNSLVFFTKNGTPCSPRNVYRKFQETLKKAGLQRVPLHRLRDTYDALEIAAKTPAKFIQQQMGHASITTTFDVYGKPLPATYMDLADLDDVVFSRKVAPANDLLRKLAEWSGNKGNNGQDPTLTN